jgi:hypothetical protein
MFLYQNIRNHTWTSPDGKTHNHIRDILTGSGRHSSLLHVWYFSAAISDNDHYLVVARVREKLLVSKRGAQKINEEEIGEQYQRKSQTGLQLWIT